MTRPIEDINIDLRETREEIAKLHRREAELKQELDERRISDAEAGASPLIGKRVKWTVDRKFRDYMGRVTAIKPTTYHGTVIVMTRDHRRVSGLGFNRPGDLIVLSDTGKKGWSLTDSWQLDEEQSK